MTEKKLAANRKNALKSTGPKTPVGKTTSSRNAVKHGILAITPIVSGLESREAWDGHQEGIFKSLAPVGYIESLLAVRIAILWWRLSRIVRYEAEVAEAAIASAEPDLEDSAKYRCGKPSDPAESRAKAKKASLIVEMLRALPNMADGERLDTQIAVATLWALWEELPEGAGDITIPGIPDNDASFDAFDGWTADLLRKAVEVYARAARTSPENLVSEAVASASENQVKARKEERELVERGRQWELRLERESRSRMLLEPDVLDKVARYESGLERSLFRALHELQRIQAARAGIIVPPPAAMDVDLTVHQDAS
jgi:hypothetical protein